MNYDSLFTPFQYKKLKLRNRLVMAPMTRTFATNGIPNQDMADYYRRRAQGEVGLILTEGTVIERPASKNQKDIPNFYGTEALQAWKNVADSVHQHHGAIAPQIWHVGNTPYGDWRPDAPFEGPESMSLSDIQAAIDAYATAAKNAVTLGFDAVELHGAHGYLIDQFFWDRTNTRTDEYGGKTLKERTRFGVDVVKAVRAAVGADVTIILRLSEFKGQDFSAKVVHAAKDIEDWILPLVDAGVDIFHASQRRFWEPTLPDADLNLAGWFKRVSGKPTITVGSVGLSNDMTELFTKGQGAGKKDLGELLRRYERGDFDLVAVGRAILQDPEWVKKVKEGRWEELRDFEPASVGKLY